MVKQRSNSTKDIESDMQGYCLGMKNKYSFFLIGPKILQLLRSTITVNLLFGFCIL